MSSLSTPILLIVFRRPDLTACVFERIREAKPEKLYISIDGPVTVTDSVMVKQVIKIIKVDWDCEVFWKINSENLGCRLAVSSAITWFFNLESKGIILEDDCLPDPAFFSFCEKMLTKYEYDSRIGHISGSSFIKPATLHSHYFSKYSFTWGWASWSRVWRNYDSSVSDFRSLDYGAVSESLFERVYWYEKFEKCNGGLDTWDYQLTYLMFKYRYLSVTPSRNLICNIGFNNRATHWNLKNLNVANLSTDSLDRISFPKEVEAERATDALLYGKIYRRILPSNILHAVRHLIRHGFDSVLTPMKPLQVPTAVKGTPVHDIRSHYKQIKEPADVTLKKEIAGR